MPYVARCFESLGVLEIPRYEADVKFLDSWDLAWEEWQEAAGRRWAEH